MTDDSSDLNRLISFDRLQAALQRFSASIAMGCIIVDAKGEALVEVDWPCFCKNNRALSGKLAGRCCVEIERFLAGKFAQGETASTFTCDNGFSHIGAPIFIAGAHVATVFIGLFLLSPPDEGEQKRIAAARGFDAALFCEAAAALPVLAQERLPQLTSRVAFIAELLAEMGHNSLLERQARQQLQSSEERFRMVADFSGQLMYDHDVLSGKVLWSGRSDAIIGYSLTEMNSHGFLGWVERIHPDDLPTVLTTLETARQHQKIFTVHYRFRKADGAYVHMYEEGAYFYDNRDQPIRMLGTLKDVSVLKMAEEALHRSETRLAIAINATSDAIWEWYPQSNTLYFSPRWYEMLGYADNNDTMDIEGWRHRCHPDDIHLFSSILEQIASTPSETGLTLEFRMRHRDGTWVWILSRGKVTQRDAAGNPLALAGTSTNITKRKVAELKLKESEQRYRTLFETASDAILILKDGLVVDCNQQSMEMFRCSRQELIGRSPEEISPEVQPDGLVFAERGAPYIAKALQGTQQKFEWLHSRFDGTLFHADVSLSVIDLAGTTYLQAIVRDITDWKKTEKALRESEFRFRSFFNTSPEGILLIDFQGTILDVNRAFLQESGYTLAETADRHFKEFISPVDQARVVDAMAQLKSGLSQNTPLRFSYIAKDGTVVPVAAKGWLVVDEKSTPLYLGVFIRNLTMELALAEEKSVLEKQVIHAQKNEAIGTLAGGIAHDFNNILGGVIGFTELALYRDPASVDPRMREYLERVLEGGNRAKDLVQQILRFSRHSNTVMEPIHLVPLIKESIALLRSTLPSTISIEQRLTPVSDRILGDATQMHQVVMNLATNAYHAMRETGGLLTIKLDTVFLNELRHYMSMAIPPGEYLRLQVHDTGSGMPPAVLERIFEPYFTTKKVNEGTGLGMAVVMGIVKSHQGLIEIETTPGKGTRIDVYLPLTQKTVTGHDVVPLNLPLGHGQRVLIVDDEAFFLEVIAESLKLLGYQAVASQSSLATLKTFKDHPGDYDLLITDQTMPEMTGVQLAQEIRRIDKTMPIILCTGYSEIVTEYSAAYYGITSFLMKPVNIHDLARAVDAVLATTRESEQSTAPGTL